LHNLHDDDDDDDDDNDDNDDGGIKITQKVKFLLEQCYRNSTDPTQWGRTCTYLKLGQAKNKHRFSQQAFPAPTS